jgi:haloacid dehalogenase superfamily, subfamily IA, variant 3 with third motif having DD or ED/beta-phosphoglucomutase family hydrolase
MTDLSSKAFIFDMDGTLVDNMRVHSDAWRILLEENGVEMDEHKFLVATAGRTNREIIPEVFGDVSEKRISELAVRKETLYREAFLPHRKPIAGVVEFLEESKGLGIKMAVATAASNPNMEFILDGLDLRKYFDAITTAADVKLGKPDPAMFLVSAEKLGVSPIDCIVFEDALGGFEAAKRAGMKAIGITTVNSADEVLKAEAVIEAHSDFLGLHPGDLARRCFLGS